MPHLISYESNPKPEDVQILNDGIALNAKQKKEMDPLGFHAFLSAMKNIKLSGAATPVNFMAFYISTHSG